MHKPYFQNILSQFEGVAPVVAPEQEPETKVFEMQVEQVVQVLTASSILGKFFTMLTEFEKKTQFRMMPRLHWLQNAHSFFIRLV